MKILIQIVLSFFLLWWPLVLFTSVMMFDAPGSTEKIGNIVFVLGLTFYPVLIGVGVYLFKFPLWGIPPKYVLAATVVVPILGAFLFGYPQMLKTRLAGLPTRGYFVKESKVYYAGRRIEADPATFAPFNEEDGIGRSDYARDREKVFARGKTILGADPATFKFVGQSHFYQKDNNRVYYNGRVLESADPGTFETLKTADGKPTEFYRDRTAVYFGDRPMPLLKGATARLVGRNVVADDQNAVFYNQPLEGVDVKTLRAHPDSESVALDKVSVFYEGIRVPGADPTTFKPLERSYAKDARRVYHFSQKKISVVEGADAPTFEVTSYDSATGTEAKDKSARYMEGRRK